MSTTVGANPAAMRRSRRNRTSLPFVFRAPATRMEQDAVKRLSPTLLSEQLAYKIRSMANYAHACLNVNNKFEQNDDNNTGTITRC